MKNLRTKAIVLKRTNYGEADRVLQLLTPSGKLSVIARGVRREKSKMAGGIELFAVCDIVIGQGRGELGILTSARLSTFYRRILQDYDRMQFGYQAIKLVSKASELVDGSDWYEILSATLAGLDSLTVNLDLVQTWFYVNYSKVSGYELSLWHDVNGGDISADLNYRYDVGERGLRPTNNGELTTDHIKLLRLVSTKSLQILSQIGGIEQIINDCLITAREHAVI